MVPPKRGEVYDLNFEGLPYADEWGTRPGIVVSNDWYNERLGYVVFVTLTARNRSGQHGLVPIPRGAVLGSPGLAQDSFAVCHSPLTVPEHSIGARRGAVGDKMVMVAIEGALAYSLGIGPDPDDFFS